MPAASHSVQRMASWLRHHLADELRLALVVRRAVAAENLVVPHRRIAIDVWLLPGIPRQPGLRFSGDESPVDRHDLQALRDRQRPLERAPVAARQVLRADDRT